MKKITAACMLIVLIMLASFHSFSQQGYYKTPAWVSEKGYWVAEKKLHVPRQCTIRFYTNDNTLVATKSITGIRLKLNRKKTKLQLKSMLEAELLQWAAKHGTGDNSLATKP